MKLKFPAIFSYALLGSRGALTGNALLPTWLWLKGARVVPWKQL
ncbi:hypothetical protein [Brevibacillus brevis]|nr:hypothetical protein [Brevibacillus brevis]